VLTKAERLRARSLTPYERFRDVVTELDREIKEDPELMQHWSEDDLLFLKHVMEWDAAKHREKTGG
jgi:hypothetical protein